MEVRVKVFGPAVELAGSRVVCVRVEPGIDEAALRNQIAAEVPPLAALARQGRLAVNRAFARPGEPIMEGDEVALIAMVSGG
ncbi:MAG: MoaD/ThiS family protein [Phycisphaerales bacterium]|nr:MoaD/ThiS family protein [Phycisphaerales bacterium]